MNKDKVIPIIIVLFAVFIGGYLLLKDDNKIKKIEENQLNTLNLERINKKNIDGYYDINIASLKEMQDNEDLSLVNVHIPYAGEIPNTDAFIPYNAIEKQLDQLPSDKSAKIIIYCRSGSMSAVASKQLAELGYTNIYNLLGGMNDWEREGNTLIRR